jgi:hypothetical protein
LGYGVELGSQTTDDMSLIFRGDGIKVFKGILKIEIFWVVLIRRIKGGQRDRLKVRLAFDVNIRWVSVEIDDIRVNDISIDNISRWVRWRGRRVVMPDARDGIRGLRGRLFMEFVILVSDCFHKRSLGILWSLTGPARGSIGKLGR